MIVNKDKKKCIGVCNNRFIIKKKINSGSFGVVYLSHDREFNENIAIKIENLKDSKPVSLHLEEKLLFDIQGQIGLKNRQIFLQKGIPKLIWYGSDQKYAYLAIQLLGHDLASYQKKLKKFSLKCVINIAVQMLMIIENVHQRLFCFQTIFIIYRGIIHRDIKPENFLVGKDQDSSQLYLIDFGIAKYYKYQGEHIEFKEGKPFIGTTRYASLAAHRGQEMGRKDDLESLGFVINKYMQSKGSLPWQRVLSKDEQDKIKQVFAMKQQISLSELCQDIPNEIYKYMSYIRNLQFKSKPDYQYLQQLFMKMASQNNFQIDRKFDWVDVGTTTTKTTDTFDKRRLDQEIDLKKFSLKDINNGRQESYDFEDSKRNSSRHKSAGNESSIKLRNSSGSKQSSLMISYVPSVRLKLNSHAIQNQKYEKTDSAQQSNKEIKKYYYGQEQYSEKEEDLNFLEMKLNEDRFYDRRNRQLDTSEQRKIKVIVKEIIRQRSLADDFEDFRDDISVEQKIKAINEYSLQKYPINILIICFSKFKEDLQNM